MSSLNRLLLAELGAGLRSGRLWVIVLRNAIPVAGAFVLGWPATLVVVFYLVEIWLYLSLRWSVEIALESSGAEPSTKRVLAAAGFQFLVMAPVLGAVLALIGWVVVRVVAERWSGLRIPGPELALGVLLLAFTLAIEVFQFMRRGMAGASDLDDELREGAMMYRAACLLLAGIPIYFLVPTRYAAEALVLLVTAASVWVEGAPRHATRVMGMPRHARRRLFRRLMKS